MFRGGTSSQRTSTNRCELLRQLPEVDPLGLPFCDVHGALRTQFKGFGSYTIPRVDVMLSATIQSLAGPEILANYVATSAQIAPSLGRPLAGGASNVTVNIVEPGTIYGSRVNQLDLRVGKVLRFGATRANVSLDMFNVLNANTPLGFNNSFGTWQADLGAEAAAAEGRRAAQFLAL
jgi:hypothetical protein